MSCNTGGDEMQVGTMSGNIELRADLENVWPRSLREPGHFEDMKPSTALQNQGREPARSAQSREKCCKFDVLVLNVGRGLLNLEINVLIWRHFPDPEPAHVTSSSSLLFLNFCK